MGLVYCPKCGEEISDKAISCPHCNFAFSKQNIVKCEECGMEYESNLSACPKCGCPKPSFTEKTQKNKHKGIIISIISVALIAVFIEIYNSIKNGNDYTESVDNSEYISEFSSYNSLDLSGNLLYSYDEAGNELYRLTKPRIVFTEDYSRKIAADYSITVPLYFAGFRVTEVTVPIRVESKFNDKF